MIRWASLSLARPLNQHVSLCSRAEGSVGACARPRHLGRRDGHAGSHVVVAGASAGERIDCNTVHNQVWRNYEVRRSPTDMAGHDLRPSTGGQMELLNMADDGLAQSSLPVFHPLEARAPPLRGTSISRMEELQQYLRQCDDRQCFKMYFKVLNSCPRVLMEEIAQQLRRRCAWLAFEEQREYKRAKALNIMGRPGSVPPASPGVGTRDGADAFCLGVLQDNTSPGIFETGPTAVAEPGSPTAGGRLRDDDNFDEEVPASPREEGPREPAMTAHQLQSMTPLSHAALSFLPLSASPALSLFGLLGSPLSSPQRPKPDHNATDLTL
uniref:Uncharacterized protein n=1 Tax=Auxenochlorella protothecoides TaxID=3075 RepID=A0A1D1ZTK3_AUXPR